MLIDKRTLDTLGGVGSVVGGLGCIGLAMLHDPSEKMFAVWLVASFVLVANGILMLIHAHQQDGLPGLAKEMIRPPHTVVESHARH